MSDYLIYRGGINMIDERYVLVIFLYFDDEIFLFVGILVSYI